MKDDLKRFYAKIDKIMADSNADKMRDHNNKRRFSYRIIGRGSRRYDHKMIDGARDRGFEAVLVIELIDSWCTLNNTKIKTNELYWDETDQDSIDEWSLCNGWKWNSFIQYCADGMIMDSPPNVDVRPWTLPFNPSDSYDDITGRTHQDPSDEETAYLTDLFANFNYAESSRGSRKSMLRSASWSDGAKVPECYDRFFEDKRVAFLDQDGLLIAAFGQAYANGRWFILYRDDSRIFGNRDRFSWHSIMFEIRSDMMDYLRKCDPTRGMEALIELSGI